MTELLIASGITALLLLAEHIALWRRPWRLSRPQAYALGTATIATGYTGWAWAFGVPGAALALWMMIIVCGSVVWGAYYIRKALAGMTETARLSGRAGRPRTPSPLDQNIIDHGGR